MPEPIRQIVDPVSADTWRSWLSRTASPGCPCSFNNPHLPGHRSIT